MENYLLRDLVLNKSTICSVDEAVAMMLGIQKGVEWYIDVEMENENYESFRRTFGHNEEPEPQYFDLSYALECERTDLQNDYYEAKEAGNSKATLQKKLNAIKEFDDTKMKLAKIYLCMIDEEFLKGTDSELRFNEHKQINLASLGKWWEKQKTNDLIKTSIFKDMQFKVPKPKKADDDNSPVEINTYVTLGLALKALINQSQTEKYGTVDNPTINPLANALSENLTKQKGQSVRSITKRITKAFAELNDHLK